MGILGCYGEGDKEREREEREGAMTRSGEDDEVATDGCDDGVAAGHGGDTECGGSDGGGSGGGGGGGSGGGGDEDGRMRVERGKRGIEEEDREEEGASGG